jgi:type II secretory pathway component PulF
MIGVILLLIVYVVPKLTEIFKTLDKPLPWHTQFLINLSNIQSESLSLEF